jgi:ABC-type methionine transport system permease subunit
MMYGINVAGMTLLVMHAASRMSPTCSLMYRIVNSIAELNHSFPFIVARLAFGPVSGTVSACLTLAREVGEQTTKPPVQLLSRRWKTDISSIAWHAAVSVAVTGWEDGLLA